MEVQRESRARVPLQAGSGLAGMREVISSVYCRGADDRCRFRHTASESLATLDELALWKASYPYASSPPTIQAFHLFPIFSQFMEIIGLVNPQSSRAL